MSRARSFLLLISLMSSVLVAGACAGCRRAPAAPGTELKAPTVRLIVMSTLAGALEPCGCVKDMLGGMPHAAAMAQTRRQGPAGTLLLAAGPTFFLDPSLKAEAKDQDVAKAEAIADALSDMQLAAWAPGANDWAAGPDVLARLREKSHAALLASNLSGAVPGVEPTRIVERGGIKIGIAGASLPLQSGVAPEGVTASNPEAALKAAEKSLEAGGAKLRILLLAMPRGEALRVIENVPGFQLALVGKPVDRGEANDGTTPPQILGDTLVVQTPNHLQAVAVVDLFVTGDDVHFKDGSGIADAEKRERLQNRIAELESRIKRAEESDAGVRAEDIAARKKELESARADLRQIDPQKPPDGGSFFRYELSEVRESAGSDSAVANRVRAYYKSVNEHNRIAFADRKPEPAPEGKSSYVGVEKCTPCHESERKFWNSTPHAAAYVVLSSQDKQFNLDCVGCHVTGYERPGGSTVTHVAGLENNQCENCHGPGSRHIDSPKNPDYIISKPDRSTCAGECHHPPHVKSDWSVDESWKKIVGPGHQKKK